MSRKKRNIPLFQQALIETHCHLDYLKEISLEETIKKSRQFGIERIVTIAVSKDNLDTALEMAQQHSMVWCSQGIHPHEADSYCADTESKIRNNLRQEKVVAIGETGLDYFYDHSDRKTQCAAFEQQLQIAVDADMPVIIHTRDADADTRSILQNFANKLKCKGVIHSFTASLGLAEFCLGEGFYLGFNGITTFNKAENVRDAVRAAPACQILLETDAPYLTPVPFRGKENAPYYLPFVAEKIAAIKEMPIETLLEQVYQNSVDLFFSV